MGEIRSAKITRLANYFFQNKLISQIIFSEKEFLNFIILDVNTLEQTCGSEVLHFPKYNTTNQIMRSSIILFGMIVMIASGCFTQKDYVTEYDYNYQASFKRYKTFAFVESTESDISLIQPVLNATIGARLGSQGFKEKPEKPDMLVSYKIFKDSIRYRGYVQPEFDYWLKSRGAEIVEEDEEEEEEKERERDETYNQIKYKENNGMLVIYVIDTKRGNTIWQGYTASNFDEASPTFQADITRAAYRVMNEFKVVNRLME
ncbi:MAG: protein of unknown function containing DUF4136 domain [Algoriphagus marincola HL-49]|uniref:DUF4136 domain-containing protein n=1 Tax=Algoriphagus marincola HL-49 TaxID=1305737 RepID=A0A0P7YUJ1_9BACT|nr:MAG: protein of unknown function containing DUF4136 domain [Algoriphagus marincola HL-49]